MKPAAIRSSIWTLSFILPISIFVVIVHEIIWEKESALDMTVYQYLTRNPGPEYVKKIMTGLSFLASPYLLGPAYLIIIIWYAAIKKNSRLAMYIVSAALAGFLTTFLLKWLFQRPRPSTPIVTPSADYSFPSGHSSAAFIFYGLIIYLLSRTAILRKFKYPAYACIALLSLLIGFSRVYLRVHYASDVLAGFCIGAAWLSLSISMIHRKD